MENEHRFLICRHCGNLIGMIHDSGATPVCCGEKMTQLIANTADAAQEKHVPVITMQENSVTVTVGSTAHPMLPEHHIAWIYLQTEQGAQRKQLAVGGEPTAVFTLADGDKAVRALAFCNLHWLWKADI